MDSLILIALVVNYTTKSRASGVRIAGLEHFPVDFKIGSKLSLVFSFEICREKKMYAIIKTGGKQYRVAVGDVIDVELLDAEVGSEVKFTDVLFVNNGSSMLVGEPIVSGCAVTGELIDLVGGPKVTSVKYIPGNHRKKIGHRQHYSRVKITQIASKDGKHGS